jgi:hypothetical protein
MQTVICTGLKPGVTIWVGPMALDEKGSKNLNKNSKARSLNQALTYDLRLRTQDCS